MLAVLILQLLMPQALPKRPPPPPSALLVPISSEYLAVDPTGTTKAPSLDPGFRLTSPAAGVAFDIDADGDLEHVSWTEHDAEVAFLAIDVDQDGRITSGKELFGSQTLGETRSGADALNRRFQGTRRTLKWVGPRRSQIVRDAAVVDRPQPQRH